MCIHIYIYIYIYIYTYIYLSISIDCAWPHTNANSWVAVNGNEATYTCYSLYNLVGSNKRYCVNCEWDRPAPTCEYCGMYKHSIHTCIPKKSNVFNIALRTKKNNTQETI